LFKKNRSIREQNQSRTVNQSLQERDLITHVFQLPVIVIHINNKFESSAKSKILKVEKKKKKGPYLLEKNLQNAERKTAINLEL
jgi:hypothetical protein